MDPTDWTEAERLIETALDGRPEAIERQLRLFVRAINLLALGRFMRPFAALSPDRRERVLRALESSRFLIIRRGFWGLRTLVFLGYYGRESAGKDVGYRASPQGWRVADRGAPGA